MTTVPAKQKKKKKSQGFTGEEEGLTTMPGLWYETPSQNNKGCACRLSEWHLLGML